jgi:hypothetical protein
MDGFLNCTTDYRESITYQDPRTSPRQLAGLSTLASRLARTASQSHTRGSVPRCTSDTAAARWGLGGIGPGDLRPRGRELVARFGG